VEVKPAQQILELIEAVLVAQREAINPVGTVRAVRDNRLG
jgi:hypothetical protein